ncbi:unnamed protein product [Acanthoscelides obtectus]|uniref:Uncharacterized protein n=1 Tax=Acanthoscelides obtectus TaxID=200917 RepID=A0A9P0K8A8_ACAOB|nr:unnamed protein product [Acanthoscelides obtectus]CAK1632303.1 hypothetical protein AOBTE_LOCUS7470 [Acanthoscelides obtectus]
MAGFTLQLLVFFGLVCLSYQQSSHARYALQASDDYVDLDDIETIRANGRMDFGVTGAVVAEIIKNLKDAIKIEEIFDTSLNLFKKIPIIGIIANRIEFMLKTCKCFKTAINHFLDTVMCLNC